MKKASAEYKYQFIKLVKSGRTMAEAHSMAKALTVGLTDEYANVKDKNNLLKLQGGLERIRMTRGQARELAFNKFFRKPDKISFSREEHLANYLTGRNTQTPINWERDGNLIRRGPPHKPRPGSSKKIVRPTKIVGVDRTLKQLRKLFNTLQKLQRAGKLKNTKALDAAAGAIKTVAKASGTPKGKG